jgi:acyl CoA:acetate/3-ketoacid CoA transferase beta subunit
VTNLCVLDFETPDRTMRIASCHPGVRVEDVVRATGFPLVIPDRVETTRAPTEGELRLIRDVIDPEGSAGKELTS